MLPILRSSVRPYLAAAVAGSLLAACSTDARATDGRKTVVVTYSVLGSLVREVVGNSADVVVLIPNGADPHEWEASAKDVARVNHADLIVRNGLDLEGGIQDALDRAQSDGVPTFSAADHITVRHVGEGEGTSADDPDQAVGAADPHLWMDPLTMKDVISALAPELQRQGIGSSGVPRVMAELDAVNQQVAKIVAAIPPGHRKLVTGHESLGYFAARFGFELVGAVIPSLTTQAGASARALAELSDKIEAEHVEAVFIEIGTPKQVVDAIAHETGVSVVELASHNLPSDGSYSTFLLDDAERIAAALA
jgi:zinc/manganese transport system substrate-binding protein